MLLAGCRVDTRVEVSANSDGSGVVRTTVSLDEDAINQLGGINQAASQVPVNDLRAAGWTISPWQAVGTTANISFSHPYRGEAELARRIGDLVGPQGVLREAKITHGHGWLTKTDGLSLVVDLRSPSTGIGSDADLRARLTRAGMDPAKLDAQLRQQLRDSLHVQLVLKLANGETRTYDAATGKVTTAHVSQSKTNYDSVVKLALALVLALIAGMFLLAASVGARRERRRREERSPRQRVATERAPLM